MGIRKERPRTMGSLGPCSHRTSNSPLAEPELRRMVIWDWYDGPETGILICDKCESNFYFSMVDWSQDQNTRIFALQRVNNKAIESLLVDEEPCWPIWMPQRLKFPSETDRNWIDQLDSIVLGLPEPPTLILGWSNLKNIPLRLAEVTATNAPFIRRLLESENVYSPYNWLEFLGLSR